MEMKFLRVYFNRTDAK